MADSYRILIDERSMGVCDRTVHISKEGAELIYSAYIALFGNSQTMDMREKRGGICWLSELNGWISQGLLPSDFDWKDYQIS